MKPWERQWGAQGAPAPTVPAAPAKPWERQWAKPETGFWEAAGRGAYKSVLDTASGLGMAAAGAGVLVDSLADDRDVYLSELGSLNRKLASPSLPDEARATLQARKDSLIARRERGSLGKIPNTELGDLAFRNVVEPLAQESAEQALNPALEDASLLDKIGFGGGYVAGMLPTVIGASAVGAGSRAANLGRGAMAANTALAQGVGPRTAQAVGSLAMRAPQTVAASQGFAVPATITRARELTEQGADVEDVRDSAAGNYLANTLMGLLPAAASGNLATRVGTGAALNTGLGVGARALEGELLGDDNAKLAQKPLGSEELIMDALLGGLMGGAFGGRPSRAQTPAEVPADLTKALAATMGDAQSKPGQETPPPATGRPAQAGQGPAPKFTAEILPNAPEAPAGPPVPPDMAQRAEITRALEALDAISKQSQARREQPAPAPPRYEGGIDYQPTPIERPVPNWSTEPGATDPQALAPEFGQATPPEPLRATIETPAQFEREQARRQRIDSAQQALGDAGLPPGFSDARLKRLEYREGLQALVQDMARDGRWRPIMDQETGMVVGNTGSQQAPWAQGSGVSRKQAQVAVDKALKGLKLGPRQAEVIGWMLDELQSRRFGAGGDYRFDPDEAKAAMIDQARNRRDVARIDRQIGPTPEYDETAAPLDSTGEPYFARGQGRPEGGASDLTASARAAVEPLISGLRGRVPVEVVRSAQDLPFQAEPGALAAYNPRDGRVYVLAEEVMTATRENSIPTLTAQSKLVHEIVGHRGLHGLLGEQLNPVLDQVFNLYAKGELVDGPALENIARTYELDLNKPAARRLAAEEYIAHAAERGTNPALLDRVIAAVRAALRQIFPNLQMSAAEVRQLIADSRRFAEGRRGPYQNSARGGIPSAEQGLAAARQQTGDPRYAFAGQKSKTADLQALERAKDMEQAGADRQEIIAETGWFRGTDTQWRYEIPDEGARWRADADENMAPPEVLAGGEGVDLGREGRTADVFDHPALFEAYPHLGDETLSERPMRARGSAGSQGVSLNSKTDPVGSDSGRSVLLHELQHRIQQREGFAKGGSPAGEAARVTEQSLREAVHMRDLWREALAAREFIDSAGKSPKEAAGDRELGEAWRVSRPNAQPLWQIAQVLTDYNGRDVPIGTLRRNAAKAARDLSELEQLATPRGAALGYRRLAGETEARNVQTRADYSPAQRFMEPPWKTEDVPADDQRVRFAKARQVLERAGVRMHEYDPKVDDDRARVIAEASSAPDEDGIRFARRNNTATPRATSTIADSWRRGSDPVWNVASDYATRLLSPIGLAASTPKAFRNMLREMRAKQQIAAEKANDVAKHVRSLPEGLRNQISDYIENELAAGVVPPQVVRDLATMMQTAHRQQGQRLVELGMLEPESHARLSGAGRYLARYYTKHILNNPFDKAIRATMRQGIQGDRLKGRGLHETIKAGDWDQYKALGWELRGLDEAEVRDLGKHTEIQVWRDFTKAERERMGEIRDAGYRYVRGYLEAQRDIAMGELFADMAARGFARDTQPGNGWVQVPSTKVPGTGVQRYGKLAGKWVESSVWDELQVVRPQDPAARPLLRAYLKGLSLWKEGKTALNPVVHGNNVVSNVMMADLAGVPLWKDKGRHAALTWREYRSRGRWYREAQEAGLFGTEFYGAEIGQLLPELSQFRDVETASAGMFTKALDYAYRYSGAKTYREKMGRLYGAEDQFFKLLVYIDQRKKGVEKSAAVDEAERWFFNYADIPWGVRVAKATVLPFASYAYKAVPALAYAAVHTPWRFAKWFALFGGLNWMAYEQLFGDDASDREDTERKLLPEYMRGRSLFAGVPKSVRLPTDSELGNPMFLDISRRVPMGDLFDMHNQTGGAAWPAPLMPNNPLLGLYAGLFLDKDPFTGREVVRAKDKGEEVSRRAGWVARQLLPNTPVLPGSYSWNKVMNGLSSSAFEGDLDLGPLGEYTGEDYYGRRQNLSRALADTLTGTKIREVDLRRQRQYQIGDLNREQRQLMGDLRSTMRSRKIGDDTKNAEVERIRALIRKNADARANVRSP